jgi:tRNA pseudouridine55 synthase
MTSHDVVARVRRITNVKRVGHGGTLDPFASGVLPVFVGQATRVIEYVSAERKTYEGTAILGISTDSYDVEGRITSERPVPDFSAEQITQVLAGFTGMIEQTPPKYSAIKVGGERLYKYARAGEEVEIPRRTVCIHSLQLKCFHPPCLKIVAEVSRGTYIRSLVNDIGESLGCGAYLHALVRTKNGPFNIEDSIDLETLQEVVDLGYWDKVAYAADEVLTGLPAVILSTDTIERLQQGKDWTPEDHEAVPAAPLMRAYSEDGTLVAMLSRTTGNTWHPGKVFNWNR